MVQTGVTIIAIQKLNTQRNRKAKPRPSLRIFASLREF